MSARIATRSIAVLVIVLPLIFGASVTAFAQYTQYQFSALDATAPSSQTAATPEPFGLDALPLTGGQVLSKWTGVVAAIRTEREILSRCRYTTDPCPAAAQKFLTVIADGRAHDGRARFGVINRAINMAIEPMSDQAQWGVADRWSAPLVTLTTGRGDCEDYAIAKYVALEDAGVADEDLRLVIVRDLALGQDHAVVAARLDQKWIVLDNRRLALVEDVEMPRVVPLFVLDRDGVGQFAPAMIAEIRGGPEPSALGF